MVQSVNVKRGIVALGAAFAAALAALTLLSGVKPACAQNAAAPTFGSVDMARIVNEYKGRQQSVQELGTLQQALSGVLRRLDQGSGRFLTEAEMKELAALYEKPTPSDGEKQRIGALEQKGDLSQTTLRRLENIASPDDAQKKQLSDLTAAQQKGNEYLQALQGGFQQRLSVREGEIQQKISAQVKAAIAKVAQDKKISVVFPADVALYTANDLTSDVLKALNK